MYFEFYSLRFLIIGIVASFYLVIGSISDLKTREVLNYSNFSLVAIGFALNSILAVTNSDYMILVESIVGFGVCYGIAYIMYYTGQWGGGDAKLLMGIGALFGFQLDFSTMPFVIEFFINTLLLGAVYGMLWSLTLAVVHIKVVSKRLKKRLRDLRKQKYAVWIVTVVLFIAAIITVDYLLKIFLLIIGLFVTLMFYVWNFTKVVEKTIMYKDMDPKDITEGEWIVDDVIMDKKVFLKKPEDGKVTLELIKKIKSHLLKYKKEIKVEKKILGFTYTRKTKITNLEAGFRLNQKIISEKELIMLKEKIRKNTLLNIKIKRNNKEQTVNPSHLIENDVLLDDIKIGFLITGPGDLGIENYQIDILRELKKQNKIKTVLIKEGIPFVPSFLFGFIATVIFPGFLFTFF